MKLSECYYLGQIFSDLFQLIFYISERKLFIIFHLINSMFFLLYKIIIIPFLSVTSDKSPCWQHEHEKRKGPKHEMDYDGIENFLLIC